MDVVRECNEAWEKLITGKTPSGGVATYVFLLCF
jgi:inorganic pyrophosphatase